jgi:hypothetical protein
MEQVETELPELVVVQAAQHTPVVPEVQVVTAAEQLDFV